MAYTDLSLNATTIRGIALDVQDDLHSNKKAEALKKASDGGERIRFTVKTKGRRATEMIVEDGGATPSVAKALVKEASKEPKTFPRSLMAVLLSRSLAERHVLTPEALTSNETSRWIDDVEPSDKQSMASSNDLLDAALDSRDVFTCLYLALKVSQRTVRCEQATALALYSLSNDFERDYKDHVNGKAKPEAKIMFELLGKVIAGTVDEEDRDRTIFRESLIACVEDACMERGDLQQPNRPGTDARVWSKTSDGRPLLIAAYTSTQEDSNKPLLTAYSIEKHLRGLVKDLPEDGEIMIVLSGASQVAEIARMRGENRDLAPLADDVAILRTASTMFEIMDDIVIPEVLRGRIKFAGWFSSAEPCVLDTDFAKTVQKSLDFMMSQGYPNSKGRGLEVMTQTLHVITHWARRHPESFPYFEDQKVINWIRNCPTMKDGVASVKGSALDVVRKSKETAILDAEMDRVQRQEEIARDQAMSPSKETVAELKQLVMDTLIGEDRRFKSLEGTSGGDIQAFINEGDAEAIRRIIDGENPRKLRDDVREARAVAYAQTSKVKNGRTHR